MLDATLPADELAEAAWAEDRGGRVIGVEGEFDVVGARAALAYFATLDPRAFPTGTSSPARQASAKNVRPACWRNRCFARRPKSTVLGYCGHCVGCSLFTAGTHPDFVFHEGSIKIGKEPGSAFHDEDLTARDLVRELALHGYRNARRIVVLGDVEFATHEAANALLKFFEEPPAGCRRALDDEFSRDAVGNDSFAFRRARLQPLDTATVEAVLVKEGVALAQAALAAKVSLGSITRARAVLGEEDEGMRGAAFAWFAETLQGEVADQSFLRLDDRSLSAGEKRAIVSELIEVVRVAARDWAALNLAGEEVPLLAADQRKRLRELPAARPKRRSDCLPRFGKPNDFRVRTFRPG